MDYDFRTRTGQSYDPNYSRQAAASSSAHPSHGKYPSLYPNIGGSGGSSGTHGVPARNHQFQRAPAPPSTSGIGITVAIKPEYKIAAPPPLLSPHAGEIPRSSFHFNFEFERILLAEAVKEIPNWSRLGLETVPPKPMESTSDNPSADNHIVSNYIASGLNREAVPVAVANYGDNPAKVKEFADGYTLLREMGFSANSVADALFMYDNDTDKALAHFLNGAS